MKLLLHARASAETTSTDTSQTHALACSRPNRRTLGPEQRRRVGSSFSASVRACMLKPASETARACRSAGCCACRSSPSTQSTGAGCVPLGPARCLDGDHRLVSPHSGTQDDVDLARLAREPIDEHGRDSPSRAARASRRSRDSDPGAFHGCRSDAQTQHGSVLPFHDQPPRLLVLVVSWPGQVDRGHRGHVTRRGPAGR
jgi:hypothetical protein